jgi:hypothetical protein
MAEMPLTYCVADFLFATRFGSSRRKLCPFSSRASENERHEELLAGRILPSW